MIKTINTQQRFTSLKIRCNNVGRQLIQRENSSRYCYRTTAVSRPLLRTALNVSRASCSAGVKDCLGSQEGCDIAFQKASSSRRRRTIRQDATSVAHLKIIQLSRFKIEYDC
mmetsp:Transcript_37172/g.41875  ORF Transcript_37172/g.41875 Transcript_37172/m.41875 type:complete len:112 (+) Transcript_37172:377-712(+)